MKNNKSNNIAIFDTTLRDGEQTPGVNITLSEKLELAKLLETLGVDIIEAGFPAASDGVAESVKAVAESVSCTVAAMARCIPEDVKTAWDAIKSAKKPRLHLVLATSDIHLNYKLKLTREEALYNAAYCVRQAKTFCRDIEFTCEDASRSDLTFLRDMITAVIDAGSTTVNITDTVGYAVPVEFGNLIRHIQSNVPNISKVVISAHCHNDLGLAVANTLAAVENGARQVETTLIGLGERAGNCSMEELIMVLNTRGSFYPMTHNIDTKKLYGTCRRVSELTALPIAANKPVIGDNAFAHASGIHIHGVLSNPLTYEVMKPETIGKAEHDIVLSKQSGRHGLIKRLEGLGFTLSVSDIETAFAAMKELAQRKAVITDDDLTAIMSDIHYPPNAYALDTYKVESGNRVKSKAEVTLKHSGILKSALSDGDGPVDAVFNAVYKLVSLETSSQPNTEADAHQESIAEAGAWSDFELISYVINAVTGGVDALGEVTVRVKHRGKLFVGRGLASDILEASVHAYLNAINRAIAAFSPLNALQ